MRWLAHHDTRGPARNWDGERIAAQTLADNIQTYWHKLGYTAVRVWIEYRPCGMSHNYQPGWDIRSNLAEATKMRVH